MTAALADYQVQSQVKFGAEDIGRRVVYRTHDAYTSETLEGTLTGVSDRLVFVRFEEFGLSVACLPTDVEFAFPSMLDDRREVVRQPKFANVFVQITQGPECDALTVLGKVENALRVAGATDEQVHEFWTEATTSDFEHLLITCMEWVHLI